MIPALGLSETIVFFLQFLVAMLRVGAFLVSSPVFGGRFVPLPIRVIASVVITLPVVEHVQIPDAEIIASLAFFPVILSELGIGLVAGLVMSILFGAASVAGDRIASTAGLGFAAQFDPAAGGQTPVVSSIFSLFLLSVFVGLDGHLIALRIILESYHLHPIGQFFDVSALISTGIVAGGAMFAFSATIMLPVVSVLLLLNIVIGVVTRSAPQLNVFSFGFPITMASTMLLILVFAPSLIASFEDLVDQALLTLGQIMGG